MEVSRIPEPYEKGQAARLQQGDIFREVTLFEGVQEEEQDSVTVLQRQFPYIVVLTQDCDLVQDFNNRANSTSLKHDKYLQSVLLCPAYPSEIFKVGKHLEPLHLVMEPWGERDMKKIRQNAIYRFHTLQSYPTLQIPELVIDFKNY